jgi:hypothetical protein
VAAPEDHDAGSRGGLRRGNYPLRPLAACRVGPPVRLAEPRRPARISSRPALTRRDQKAEPSAWPNRSVDTVG